MKRLTIRTLGLGAVVVLLTVLLVGVSRSRTVQGSVPVAKNQKEALHKLAKISLTEAIETALSKHPGTAVEAELEDEDGYLVYEVEIRNSKGMLSEVTVDAGNGKVLAIEDEDEEDDHDGEKHDDDDDDGEKHDDDGDDDAFRASIQVDKHQKNLHLLTKISMRDAQEAALAAHPGAIIEAELEREHGYLVYSIEIADSANKIFEVIVDAGTGKVVEVEEEDED